MHTRNKQNQQQGAWFEKMFRYRASIQRLLCVRNGQECRFIGQGKVLPIKSNLDWTIGNSSGVVAFCDTKSFEGDSFTYSQLSIAQVDRAREYDRYHIRAGFVVYLRGSGIVVWYAISDIEQKGPRTRFIDLDGTILGNVSDFDLAAILL